MVKLQRIRSMSSTIRSMVATWKFSCWCSGNDSHLALNYLFLVDVTKQCFLRLQELVDIDIFVDARKVVDALLNKDCSEALAWCAENKSKLKKSKVLVNGLVSNLMTCPMLQDRSWTLSIN